MIDDEILMWSDHDDDDGGPGSKLNDVVRSRPCHGKIRWEGNIIQDMLFAEHA